MVASGASLACTAQCSYAGDALFACDHAAPSWPQQVHCSHLGNPVQIWQQMPAGQVKYITASGFHRASGCQVMQQVPATGCPNSQPCWSHVPRILCHADLLRGGGVAKLKPLLGVRYEFGQGRASLGAHSVHLRQHVPVTPHLGLEVGY